MTLRAKQTETLTPREKQVQRLLDEGLSRAMIAKQLSICKSTVNCYVVTSQRKLNGIVSSPRVYRDLGRDLLPREKQVLSLIARGFNNLEIAKTLKLNRDVVAITIQACYQFFKMVQPQGPHTRVNLAMLALRLGYGWTPQNYE